MRCYALQRIYFAGRNNQGHVSKHLMIADASFSGTGFLVQYLAELGLETRLTGPAGHALWDAQIDAALKEPRLADLLPLPYVIDPAYPYGFLDNLLARGDIRLDGVIVTIRDPLEDAKSPPSTGTKHQQHNVPGAPDASGISEQWTLTPEGIIHSLNVLDQTRLLAVGLHHLVERLVRARVPVRFVHLRTMINDPDDLFRQIACFLPANISIADAHNAHGWVTDRGFSVPSNRPHGTAIATADVLQGLAPPPRYPSLTENDAITQRRENQRLNEEISWLTASVHRAKSELERQSIQNNLDVSRLSEELKRRCQRGHAVEKKLSDAQTELQADIAETTKLDEQLTVRRQMPAAMQRTFSWRLTRPLRALGRVLRKRAI